MKKNIVLSILFFIFGVLAHALLFPDFLANGFSDVSQVVIPNPTSPEQNSEQNITKVTFDGEHFSRRNIAIGFTRYIQIVNESDQLMWLVSNAPELTTSRGYGKAEAVQMQFNKKGQFLVINKNNPQEKLVITVK